MATGENVKSAIRFKGASILARAVEEGVALGWNRAHKHHDHPGEQVMKESMERAVLEALYEMLEVDYEDDG